MSEPGRKSLNRTNFENLRVYQLAEELADAVWDLVLTWDMFARDTVGKQVVRAADSIGANIAEAWAKRRYPAHFVSKLIDADGDLQETRHWLDRAVAYGYLTVEAGTAMESLCDQIGGMLGKIIQHPESFTLTRG